jgi:hypothetical protein
MVGVHSQGGVAVRPLSGEPQRLGDETREK